MIIEYTPLNVSNADANLMHFGDTTAFIIQVEINHLINPVLLAVHTLALLKSLCWNWEDGNSVEGLKFLNLIIKVSQSLYLTGITNESGLCLRPQVLNWTPWGASPWRGKHSPRCHIKPEQTQQIFFPPLLRHCMRDKLFKEQRPTCILVEL